MKVTITGTGLTQKRADALLYVLWALDTPEQIGSCQDDYDADRAILNTFVGLPFEIVIDVKQIDAENVQSPATNEGLNPKGPRFL